MYYWSAPFEFFRQRHHIVSLYEGAQKTYMEDIVYSAPLRQTQLVSYRTYTLQNLERPIEALCQLSCDRLCDGVLAKRLQFQLYEVTHLKFNVTSMLVG